MGNTNVDLIFTIILMVIGAFVFITSHSASKNTVIEYLSKRGATDIVVTYKWFDFDRDTETFSVEFTHPNGKTISTKCKLRYWGMFANAELYWSKPTELDEPEPEQVELPHSQDFDLSDKLRLQSTTTLPTYEISTILPVSNSTDKIVMMNYTASFKNVFRCKEDGTVLWQAELPTQSDDAYTNIAWEGNQLTAFSKSCIAVTINAETGKIVSPEKIAYESKD